MNAFITSQFSYCPLVWMSHSRTMNNIINKIHEKTLRLVYKDEKNLSLDDLLKKDKSASIHQINLKILATEIYKARNDLGPEIMKDIFHSVQKAYNLRNRSTLQRRRNRTVYFGTESISPLPQKYGRSSLARLKMQSHKTFFLKKIKLCTTGKCPSRLCKRQIGNVGFI